jgi:rhodanese-related sulfurtransferase
MPFQTEQIHANRDYFLQKLNAEKQRNDVLKAIEENSFNFVLLDTRGREAFASGHIRGAVCIPPTELSEALSQLPRDKEIVTYCWSHD